MDVKIQQTDEAPAYLSSWTDVESYIDWRVSIDQPGRFELFADVAGKDSSSFSVKIGDQGYPVSTQKTGSLEQFNTQDLGTLELPKGEVVIKFEPNETQWNTLNMRSIRIIPTTSPPLAEHSRPCQYGMTLGLNFCCIWVMR